MYICTHVYIYLSARRELQASARKEIGRKKLISNEYIDLILLAEKIYNFIDHVYRRRDI